MIKRILSIMRRRSRYLFRELLFKISVGDFAENTKIQTPEYTMHIISEAIKNRTPGAYLRFGDGELNVAEKHYAIEQAADDGLANGMRKSFAMHGPGIFKSLMIHSSRFGRSEHMKLGSHLVTDRFAYQSLLRCYEYFIGDIIYSHTALHYVLVYNRPVAIQFFSLLKMHKPIFVGNENIPSDILNKLFNTNDHVKVPGKNAFTVIKEIEKKLTDIIERRNRDYEVVVLALGPSSNILQYQMIEKSKFAKKVFLFDIGSLIDAFCGWNSRSWIEDLELPQNYFNQILDEI